MSEIIVEEIWKDVIGHEGRYQVSNQGIVRSLDRKVWQWNNLVNRYIWAEYKSKILKPSNNNGYLQVILMILNKEGKEKRDNRNIHKLVLETFIGPCPNNMECRHLDGNRQNNQLSNLKWGTKKENQNDRKRHGTDNDGERNGSSKLTWKEVKGIRKLYKTGDFSYRELAEIYEISRATIRRAVLKICWK